MKFKFKWQKLGGHVHVHVWSAKDWDLTFGKNGELIFRFDEYKDFRWLTQSENIRWEEIRDKEWYDMRNESEKEQEG